MNKRHIYYCFISRQVLVLKSKGLFDLIMDFGENLEMVDFSDKKVANNSKNAQEDMKTTDSTKNEGNFEIQIDFSVLIRFF